MARKPEFTRGLDGAYNPQSLQENYTATQISKEYARLRKIFRKRVERLERSEFSLSSTALKGHSMKRRMRKGSTLSKESKAARIVEMTEWLERRSSTIKGARDIRRETREALEDSLGYKFKNYGEFRLFGQFMDYLRAMYGDRFHYLTDDVMDLFSDYSQEVLDNSMSFDEFVNLYENRYKSKPVELKRPN
ncbi:MAG: hypothetical protein J6S85_12815 [Methanobrevibacter sp.]|nr:hypothetical protein [Methanobrevibacter sp.]